MYFIDFFCYLNGINSIIVQQKQTTRSYHYLNKVFAPHLPNLNNSFCQIY